MAKVSAIKRSSLAVSMAAELPAAAAAAALRWGEGPDAAVWQNVHGLSPSGCFLHQEAEMAASKELKAKIIYIIYIYDMNHHDRSLQNSMRFM